MADNIRDYCNSHPVQRHHQKAGEKTAIKRNPMSAGWAWNPDEETKKALSRGNRKIAKLKRQQRNDEMESTKMATKKAKGKTTRKTSTKKVAKKVSKKVAKKVATKKASNRIPLKRLCSKLNLDPKMARRTLRAAGMSGHDPKARWEFTEAQAKKAEALLKA
jgi:hypothetical protein